MKKLTHEYYVELLKQHNPELVVISEFKGMAKKIKIKDRDNIIYNVTARSAAENETLHIQCAVYKTAAFNTKLKKIHPNLKLVDDYTKGNEKRRVQDELGIVYLVKPESLLLGVYPSMITAVDQNEAFRKKATVVHKDRYDYSLSQYKGKATPLKIICRKHGVFLQTPNNHISSAQGCPTCSLTRGWSKAEWLTYAKDKQCSLYIIECFNEVEAFIKVGITTKAIEQRFSNKREMPYSYKILLQIPGTAQEVWELEKVCKDRYYALKYIPTTSFHGKHECYTIKLHKNLKEIRINESLLS